ncbi:nucleoside phosphorylase domain-containing protein [Aspergillus minisclerotigenes]|uniref:Nucleoside phosphorylase domain-containing protein n=1 Tax=Aspergillus minisclerotigenes TaxID=656917 RepID=A0A5N6J125_9EURO|nr:nucleoside phosphorylase domain-containing protein [Aspergillus minisclerotigenes]
MPLLPVARPSPSQADYMIGWVCVIPEEYYAALAILDEQYDSSHIVPGQGDRSSYILGRMGKHPVVTNVPAATHYGELHASTIAKNMKSTLARIRFVLLVDIGGGIPLARDIRLGDVVLGTRVVPYALGKETDYGFVRTGQIFTPPQTLLTAITGLQALRRLRATDISRRIDSIGDRHGNGQNDYARPGEDRLYDRDYTHDGRYCDCLTPKADLNSRMLSRGARRGDLVQIHQGNIGTASVENLICFEMEATGVMLNVPCLLIRGISDYADGHKNDIWQPYAALAAAVCAKELLATMSPRDVL